MWDRELVVVDYSLGVNNKSCPAHTILVFETDANTALKLLRTDDIPIATAIASKLLKVSGARSTQISEAPLAAKLEANTEKKAGLARITIAVKGTYVVGGK